MDGATESRRVGWLSAGSAGLQAGMLGAWWMLMWLGLSDVWQRRGFWTAENLMASAFYGDRAIRSGFAQRTLSGLALYLVLYSLLGALLAVVLRDRIPRFTILLVSVAFGLSWYYFSFRLIWKSLLPLVALLHSSESTLVGHLLFGAVLARYPAYFVVNEATQPLDPQPDVMTSDDDSRPPISADECG